MPYQPTQRVLIRLAKIEEHLQATIQMVHEDTSSPEVLRQIAALQSALRQLAQVIVQDYAESGLTQIPEREHLEAELEDLLSALKLFL